MDAFTIRLLQERLTNRIVVNTKDESVLVYVPAGEFEMGDNHAEDCHKHKVQLSAYWIGIYPITNGQYLKYMEESGHASPHNNYHHLEEFYHRPVTDITWDDAVAYTCWSGCQLPTEAQWEKAARGPHNLLYPWGNDWDAARCQHDKSLNNEGVCNVHSYPEGVSGYGTYNQSGNIWEWCSDFYNSSYRYFSTINPQGLGNLYMVNRGGCWNGGSLYFLATTRNKNETEYYSNNLGFRVVKNIPI